VVVVLDGFVDLFAGWEAVGKGGSCLVDEGLRRRRRRRRRDGLSTDQLVVVAI